MAINDQHRTRANADIILDELCDELTVDLLPIMGWESVRKDWPLDPDYILGWDKPTVFLKCDSISSEVSTVGARQLYYNIDMLIVYPIAQTGDHFESKNKELERNDSYIIETYLYHLNQYDDFDIKAIRDFCSFDYVTDITCETKKIRSKENALRPALVITSTFVITESIADFDYIEFLNHAQTIKEGK